MALARKSEARSHVASLIADGQDRGWRFFVRVNPFDSGLLLHDLVAAVRAGLDGIVVPKAHDAQDVVRGGHYLDALESRALALPAGIRTIRRS